MYLVDEPTPMSKFLEEVIGCFDCTELSIDDIPTPDSLDTASISWFEDILFSKGCDSPMQENSFFSIFVSQGLLPEAKMLDLYCWPLIVSSMSAGLSLFADPGDKELFELFTDPMLTILPSL